MRAGHPCSTARAEKFALPGGDIADGKLESFKAITSFNDKYFTDGVSEAIKHSWYNYSGGNDKSLHPYKGERRRTTPISRTTANTAG